MASEHMTIDIDVDINIHIDRTGIDHSICLWT